MHIFLSPSIKADNPTTLDGASMAEESSEDDDMGEYDLNIETLSIVKTRLTGSLSVKARRSGFSKRA